MTDIDELITDEMLTAYLDGALEDDVRTDIESILAVDDVLCARLAALDLPMEQLRTIMAPTTLGAPSMPKTLGTHTPIAANSSAVPPMRKLWVPAVIAASFAAGIFIAPFFAAAPKGVTPTKWVDAVASYQALYITETLDHAPQDGAATAKVLASAAENFGVALGPAIDLAGLNFKRAQMLGWNGKPLLQLAYLDSDGTPIALCLTRVGAEDRGPKSSTSHNLAGVSWVQDGVGYYMIGGQDISRVEALSAQIITSL